MMHRSPFRTRARTISHLLVGLSMGMTPAMAGSGASTYSDVLNALQSGRAVTVLTDFSQCANPETGKSGPSVQGGLQIKAFMVLPDKGLVFSDVHPTLDRTDQPVTEFIRYNLKTDGEMTLAVTRQTATGLVKQDTLVCRLPIGVQFVW